MYGFVESPRTPESLLISRFISTFACPRDDVVEGESYLGAARMNSCNLCPAPREEETLSWTESFVQAVEKEAMAGPRSPLSEALPHFPQPFW